MSQQTKHLTADDVFFLKRALELAETGIAKADGGPFGALIVKDGQIISESWNSVVASYDPTAHAEVNAIRLACQKQKIFHLTGCTLYASSEPCPMCLSAAYWAQVDRIVFANSREEAARIGFSDEDLYTELTLPICKRQIPIQHVCIEGAIEVMDKWVQSDGKVLY